MTNPRHTFARHAHPPLRRPDSCRRHGPMSAVTSPGRPHVSRDRDARSSPAQDDPPSMWTHGATHAPGEVQ